jgi:hypothetical protein
MRYLITLETDYLRAELLGQDTFEETRSFLHAVFWASIEHLRSHVLICARSTKPLFGADVEEVFPYMKRIAWYRSNKIALVGNAVPPGLSSKHIETHAQRHGINLCSFPDEAAALRWFHDRRKRRERRYARRRIDAEGSSRDVAAGPRPIEDRRRLQDRRSVARRAVSSGYEPAFA